MVQETKEEMVIYLNNLEADCAAIEKSKNERAYREISILLKQLKMLQYSKGLLFGKLSPLGESLEGEFTKEDYDGCDFPKDVLLLISLYRDAIALACTELPVVLNKQNCNIPLINTTKVLAQAAAKHIRKITLTRS